MEKAEDYPFDPDLDVRHLEGPEKLRCIPDADIALKRKLLELWHYLQQNREAIDRRIAFMDRKAEEDDLKDARSCLRRALTGEMGAAAKRVGYDFLNTFGIASNDVGKIDKIPPAAILDIRAEISKAIDAERAA